MSGSKRARLLAAASAFTLVPASTQLLPDRPQQPEPEPRVVHLASATLAAATLPPEAALAALPPPARGMGSTRVSVRVEPSDTEFDRLARCESNGRWHLDSGNGYYGGLQFLVSTWQSLGGVGRPSDHPREVQIAIARREWRRNGWRAWPACSRALRLAQRA
jgi:hypothetical protein